MGHGEEARLRRKVEAANEHITTLVRRIVDMQQDMAAREVSSPSFPFPFPASAPLLHLLLSRMLPVLLLSRLLFCLSLARSSGVALSFSAQKQSHPLLWLFILSSCLSFRLRGPLMPIFVNLRPRLNRQLSRASALPLQVGLTPAATFRQKGQPAPRGEKGSADCRY